MKKNVLSNMKKAYDNIEIPEELQERVKQGIKTGKQKEGKKRMKQVGSVEVPQEAFMAVLKMDDSNKKS